MTVDEALAYIDRADVTPRRNWTSDTPVDLRAARTLAAEVRRLRDEEWRREQDDVYGFRAG